MRLKSGIGPEKELLTKVMVRSVGISSKASTFILPERPIWGRWRPVKTPSLHMTPAQGSLLLQGEVFGTQELRAPVFERDFLRLMRASDSGMERERGERDKRRGRRRRRRTATAAGDMVDEAEEEMGQLRRGGSVPRCPERCGEVSESFLGRGVCGFVLFIFGIVGIGCHSGGEGVVVEQATRIVKF